MYFPKTLQRFAPKHGQPLTLKSLCLDATLQLMSNPNIDLDRDARTKKAIRKYMDSHMPRELQKELVCKAIGKWFGADKMLRLLEMFEPQKIMNEELNMLGHFRYAYGCYFVNHRLFWSNGTIERLNMSLDDCEKLYNILIWSSPRTLKKIAVATQRVVLKKSRLPSIIARSQILTSVTILNGATNHILRLLGLNCPLLRHVDVSHSGEVNDWGIQNLFLRNPRKKSHEKNECAKNINRLILLGTEVTRAGFELACKSLDIAYSISFLPDSVIFRPAKDTIKLLAFEIDVPGNTIWQLGWSNNVSRGVEQIVRRYSDRRAETEVRSQVLDIYEKEQLVNIFVRDPTSFIIQSYIRVDGEKITKLVLTWDSFIWRLVNLPELTDLGTELPHLRVLKARIQGTWDKPGSLLLPNLEEAHVWSLNDDTIMSFFNHSPRIKRFIFNSLNFNNPRGTTPWNLKVNDFSIQKALRVNTSLRNSIEECCIRPGPRLSSSTVAFLTTQCPNLRRLGDMESWSVSTEQIKAFNKILDDTNSRCILTVLSFPPKEVADQLNEINI